MILRRLSQSLKEQHWTAIWIEFVLLVAGVFLGIKVSNWNEERRDTDLQWLAVWNAPRMKPMTDVYRRNLLAWRAQEKQA